MSEKRKRKPMHPACYGHASGSSWRVPVAQTEIPEAGLHLDLVADAKVRADIADLAGLAALPRLEASFDIRRHEGSGLHVVGHVSATVAQTCGVTLEPMENEVEEAIDLVFLPSAALTSGEPDRKEVALSLVDAPEALIDGAIDVGALATEFLILGIDPYPRKPGSVFQSSVVDESFPHPFAALGALKKDPRSGEG